jgi:outer membrane protein OmpA-like peptidoglycan-associated protein
MLWKSNGGEVSVCAYSYTTLEENPRRCKMKSRTLIFLCFVPALALGSSACATKKYARTQVNDRVTPLERRTAEIEETTRRSNQDIAKVNQGIQDVRQETDRVQSQADRAQSKADQADSRASAVERSIDDLRANLDKYSLHNTATVNFRFDHYDLTTDAKAALDGLAAQIKGTGNYILEIEGFADSVGTDTYNDQLTQKRAESVRRYLAERHGIPLFRMRILGFGERRPVADNHTRAGRAQNRRVEVRMLTRDVKQDSAAQVTPRSQNK